MQYDNVYCVYLELVPMHDKNKLRPFVEMPRI